MSKKNSELQKIGNFIKELREKRGLTQNAFARALGTSQSAIARMEAGEQNFSTELLSKISNVLNHKLVSINDSIDFEINGGKKLSGTINTKFSKNGSVVLLCASLLNSGKTTLHNIARIEEVYRVIEFLESIDVSINWIDQNSLEVIPPKKINIKKINKESATKTRTVVMTIGPLIHLLKNFSIPHAQGCSLGKRTVSAHMYALEELGVKIQVTNSSYEVKVGKLRPREIIMYESGDTACENIIMAASKIKGKTTIKFTSANYMVQELCFFLQKLGVKINGIGTSTVTIEGVPKINKEIEYYNGRDPIESMMFISAAIVTESELTITHCPIDFLELELYKLKKMGLKYKILGEYISKNGHSKLVDIHVLPSKLKALDDKIHAGVYPAINMDNLPFFAIAAIKAHGDTLIHDWTYENRAIYLTELNKLGAEVTLADPHRAYIHGGLKLKPAQIVCPPALRPSVVIMLAMLGAEGRSILRNVYMINRGYEEIAERLNKIGADIKILK